MVVVTMNNTFPKVIPASIVTHNSILLKLFSEIYKCICPITEVYGMKGI